MLAIAHRAGNDINDFRQALDTDVDLVEADVRYFRGALEVRHLKTFGRWWLWDHPWEFVRRRDTTFPVVGDLLDELARSAERGDGPPGRAMLDLKGIRRELAPAVARVVQERAPGVPVAVCTRRWWMLDAFADSPSVRLVISAGSNRELRKLRETVRRPPEAWPGRRRAYGVSIRRTLLAPEVVTELHENVERVMVWPVDTAAELDQARGLGVSGVIGKDLNVLRDLGERR